MPNYATLAPPQALYPGDLFFAFGTMDFPNQIETGEPIGVAPRVSQRCALSQPQAAVESGGRAITYEAEFDSVPTAASLSLQGAMRDVEAEYVTLDTNAAAGALITHSKTVYGVRELFLRLRLDSITPNAATLIIAKILG